MQASPDPPSPQQVFEVLSNAASQNPLVAQAASEQFNTFKTLPGVYQNVQMVALERNLPLDVRKMAIFQFKNGAPGQWRRNQLYPEAIKQVIRSRMFSFFDEPDDVIAKTNAVAVAKIARIDYPRQWPDLTTQIFAVITTQSQAIYESPNPTPHNFLVLRRSLTTLNQVMKELAAAKVPVLINAFLALVQHLYEPLLALYNRSVEAFQTGLSLSSLATEDKFNHIFISHLSLKCIVKGITFIWQRSRIKGFEGTEPVVRSFFEAAVNRFIGYSDLRINLFQQNIGQDLIASPTQAYLAKHIRLYGKYFRRTQIFSAARFVQLPLCQALVFYYWQKVLMASDRPSSDTQDSDAVIFPTRFITQALSIFKDSVAQWSPSRQSDESAILDGGFIETAVRLITSKLLLLDQEDLEKWEEDPEEWINAEESDSDAWEFGVRPCAERVLMTLANQYGDKVAPLIIERFKEEANPANDMQAVLQKEALYCAVGRCAHRLKGLIDFDAWIDRSSAAEVFDTQPISRIIKRRIAWLFGRWFSEGNVTSSKAKVYEVLVFLVQAQGEGYDAVVRLTAATALRDCVDSVSYDGPTFLPYLPGAVQALLALVMNVESQDTKRRVLRSLNVIIEASGLQIVPYLASIVGQITALWQQADIDIPLRAEIVMTVTNLVKASKEHSAPMAPIAAALIRECFKNGLDVQMDEDAIDLWTIALRNSMRNLDPNVQDLFDLLPDAVNLFATNLDLLGKISQIMESYCLLDCTRVLQMQALPLHAAFLAVYKGALPTNVKEMLSVVNLMVQLAPSSLWAEGMHASGFFAQMLKSVIEDKSKADNTLVLVEILHLFARMIIQDAGIFLQLIAMSSESLGAPVNTLLNGFLDQWWAKFDYMIDAPRRKLVALATAQLVGTGNSEVIDRLATSEAFNIWLDVLGELQEAIRQQPSDDDDESPLVRFWKSQDELMLPDRLEDVAETLEMERRKEAFNRDPVRRIPLREFIKEKMQEAQVAAAANGVDFNGPLSKVDPKTTESLQKQLS